MSTALGIPRRSPIQVLTEPDVASLRGSDEIRCFQRGMTVDDIGRKITRHQPNIDAKVVNNHYGGFMLGFSLKTSLKYKISQLFMCFDKYIFIQPDKKTPTFNYKSTYFIVSYDINQNEI